jgi:hypothetical protein
MARENDVLLFDHEARKRIGEMIGEAVQQGGSAFGCPSSDNLRLIRLFAKGGSGSSGVRV